MFNPTSLTKKEHEQVEALKKLDIKKVKRFIERKELDINKLFAEEGRRPIHLVIPFRGPTALLEYLLDTNDIEVDALDASGNTALICAAAHGNLEACRILIQHGASYHLKSQVLKKNPIEIFKEKHGHLFSSFEEIIKEHEVSLKAEANNKTKIATETYQVNPAPFLKQRKNDQTYNAPHSTPKTALDQPKNTRGFKSGFWKIINYVSNPSGPQQYISLDNTASSKSPKLKN